MPAGAGRSSPRYSTTRCDREQQRLVAASGGPHRASSMHAWAAYTGLVNEQERFHEVCCAMKACIVGAGAIGGFIGTRLAMAGHDVSALARGATLDALRKHGWRLRQNGQLHGAPARASNSTAELGPQELVVIAVKGQSLPDVAPRLEPLLEPHTLVLPAMNGVPWWFGRGVPALEGTPLASVDPSGGVSKAIPFEQVIGCAV